MNFSTEFSTEFFNENPWIFSRFWFSFLFEAKIYYERNGSAISGWLGTVRGWRGPSHKTLIYIGIKNLITTLCMLVLVLVCYHTANEKSKDYLIMHLENDHRIKACESHVMMWPRGLSQSKSRSPTLIIEDVL